MSQTPLATKTDDTAILYGSTDPALNLATIRAQAMTADHQQTRYARLTEQLPRVCEGLG